MLLRSPLDRTEGRSTRLHRLPKAGNQRWCERWRERNSRCYARGFSVPFMWGTVSPLSSEMLLPAEAGVNRTEVLAQTFLPPANEGRLRVYSAIEILPPGGSRCDPCLAALTLCLTLLCPMALPVASHTATVGGTRRRTSSRIAAHIWRAVRLDRPRGPSICAGIRARFPY